MPLSILDPLSRRLHDAAPGTLVEDHGVWIRRLAVLARSLQACAGLALLLVAVVAAAVIAVATRAGLSTRREAIEIVHGLGATDRYIAGRFAGRATLLAASGAALGAVAALPVLLTLAHMAAPFAGDTTVADDNLSSVFGRGAGAALAGAAMSARECRRDRLHHCTWRRPAVAAAAAMTRRRIVPTLALTAVLGADRYVGWPA